MKSRKEIENAIRMIEHEITILNKITPSNPEFPEAVRTKKVLIDRIKRLLEQLK